MNISTLKSPFNQDTKPYDMHTKKIALNCQKSISNTSQNSTNYNLQIVWKSSKRSNLLDFMCFFANNKFVVFSRYFL